MRLCVICLEPEELTVKVRMGTPGIGKVGWVHKECYDNQRESYRQFPELFEPIYGLYSRGTA